MANSVTSLPISLDEHGQQHPTIPPKLVAEVNRTVAQQSDIISRQAALITELTDALLKYQHHYQKS